MKSKSTNIIMQNKNIILLALVVAFILLMPLFAMRVTHSVDWSVTDFVVAGALLFGTGLAYELVARKTRIIAYRAAVGIALATALLLVWVNLAVGIIGSENNPANLMYIGVLAVGMIGALIARFRPQGMARALFATAIAQALVAVIALIVEKDLSVFGILLPNGFFVALWVGAALLFRRANSTRNQQLEEPLSTPGK